MNYIDVANMEETVALGAKVALPRTEMPGVGAYGAIIDPAGYVLGLWERAPSVTT